MNRASGNTPAGTVSRFLADERGTTAIEYGLIAALIAVAIISGLQAVGNSSTGGWANLAKNAGNALH